MSHKLNIFLDDLRTPSPGFTLVRNVEECLLLMAEVEVDKLSLDYHLGAGRTADEVTYWIVQTGRWPAEIYLHSSDLVARQRMLQYLAEHAPETVRIYLHRYV
jgi:Cyclic-phosphate processing Receiver domain